jgi:hypothetical protein
VAEGDIGKALEMRAEGKWKEALALLDRTRERLAGAGLPEMERRLEQVRQDTVFLSALQEARERRARKLSALSSQLSADPAGVVISAVQRSPNPRFDVALALAARDCAAAPINAPRLIEPKSSSARLGRRPSPLSFCSLKNGQ